MIRRILSLLVIMSFLASSVRPVHAATLVEGLPVPGTMVNLSPAYQPLLIKGLKVYPENPLSFDFIVDTGNSPLDASDPRFKTESEKLIKYFLAALTLPENDVWVNLSPYEKDRMIPQATAKTQMGRDMLAQDYVLKQITASLIYPEKGLGQAFWNKVYQESYARFGKAEIPVHTFNKVWIIADKASIYAAKDTVFVVDSHLKVMLEKDYLAMTRHQVVSAGSQDVSSRVIKDIVLPALEHEVNNGKNFANLRQIFHALILAKWYKQALKTALLNQVYSNRNKIAGISPKSFDASLIYQEYLQAYKKGVFNYIREDIDAATRQPLPRKYFSGGVLGSINYTQVSLSQALAQGATIPVGKIYEVSETNSLAGNTNLAMTSLVSDVKEKVGDFEFSDLPAARTTRWGPIQRVVNSQYSLKANMVLYQCAGGYVVSLKERRSSRLVRLLVSLKEKPGDFHEVSAENTFLRIAAAVKSRERLTPAKQPLSAQSMQSIALRVIRDMGKPVTTPATAKDALNDILAGKVNVRRVSDFGTYQLFYFENEAALGLYRSSYADRFTKAEFYLSNSKESLDFRFEGNVLLGEQEQGAGTVHEPVKEILTIMHNKGEWLSRTQVRDAAMSPEDRRQEALTVIRQDLESPKALKRAYALKAAVESKAIELKPQREPLVTGLLDLWEKSAHEEDKKAALVTAGLVLSLGCTHHVYKEQAEKIVEQAMFFPEAFPGFKATNSIIDFFRATATSIAVSLRHMTQLFPKRFNTEVLRNLASTMDNGRYDALAYLIKTDPTLADYLSKWRSWEEWTHWADARVAAAVSEFEEGASISPEAMYLVRLEVLRRQHEKSGSTTRFLSKWMGRAETEDLLTRSLRQEMSDHGTNLTGSIAAAIRLEQLSFNAAMKSQWDTKAIVLPTLSDADYARFKKWESEFFDPKTYKPGEPGLSSDQIGLIEKFIRELGGLPEFHESAQAMQQLLRDHNTSRPLFLHWLNVASTKNHLNLMWMPAQVRNFVQDKMDRIYVVDHYKDFEHMIGKMNYEVVYNTMVLKEYVLVVAVFDNHLYYRMWAMTHKDMEAQRALNQEKGAQTIKFLPKKVFETMNQYEQRLIYESQQWQNQQRVMGYYKGRLLIYSTGELEYRTPVNRAMNAKKKTRDHLLYKRTLAEIKNKALAAELRKSLIPESEFVKIRQQIALPYQSIRAFQTPSSLSDEAFERVEQLKEKSEDLKQKADQSKDYEALKVFLQEMEDINIQIRNTRAYRNSSLDSAMKSPGGIDLNASRMTLTQTGSGVDIHFDQAAMARFKQGDFTGLVPVITGIKEIHSLAPWLEGSSKLI